MASLLERMNVDVGSTGPQRAKGRRSHSSSPYSRPPKGDINEKWMHDQYKDPNSTLLDRMGTSARSPPPKINFSRAASALSNATGQSVGSLSILGASTRSNVIDVSGLVPGTTAEDVQAIFKQCGMILSAKKTDKPGNVTVRLTFKFEKDAAEAVRKFDKQVADGRQLQVTLLGNTNTTLQGRINPGQVEGGSVDALMPSSSSSKMRSDEILKDEIERARAHILVAPPGTDPRDYTPATSGRGRGRGGRRRGGGRGRGPRGGRGGDIMDTD